MLARRIFTRSGLCRIQTTLRRFNQQKPFYKSLKFSGLNLISNRHICLSFVALRASDNRRHLGAKLNDEEVEENHSERFTHIFSHFDDQSLNETAETIGNSGDIERTVQEWTESRAVFENSSFDRVRKFWPSMIMNLLLQLKYPNMATSFFTYLVESGIPPHLSLLSQYIKLQSADENVDEILRAYDLVDTKILDSDSASKIIQGLCLTPKWREGLEIIKTSRITSYDSMQRHGPVIVAAVKNNDVELAFELLKECGRQNLVISPEIYDVFSSNASEEMMWKFLDLVGEQQWFMNSEQTTAMLEWFKNHRYNAELTKVNRQGVCGKCGERLLRSNLTPGEFSSLKTNFMRKSVIRGDIFISTTPDELKQFKSFLEKNGPFDVVIDALNVAHIGRKWDMKIVSQIVDILARRNGKILVVSRQHTAGNVFMRRLRVPVFYTSNLSKDDPFLLYAALDSGPRCQIVSRDEMRDHCYLLGEDMAQMFRKWQRGRQIIVELVRGNPRLVFPPNHQVVPQRQGSIWHVPFDNLHERASYALPDTWICASK